MSIRRVYYFFFLEQPGQSYIENNNALYLRSGESPWPVDNQRETAYTSVQKRTFHKLQKLQEAVYVKASYLDHYCCVTHGIWGRSAMLGKGLRDLDYDPVYKVLPWQYLGKVGLQRIHSLPVGLEQEPKRGKECLRQLMPETNTKLHS